MTITLSKEEVSQFKSELISWSIKRTEYFVDQKQLAKNGELTPGGPMNVGQLMAKWDIDNPAPTLVKI